MIVLASYLNLQDSSLSSGSVGYRDFLGMCHLIRIYFVQMMHRQTRIIEAILEGMKDKCEESGKQSLVIHAVCTKQFHCHISHSL